VEFDKHPERNLCPVCGSPDVFLFFEASGMPAHIGILWSSEVEARQCRRGDIRLTFCRRCGFIWNTAFDPTLLEYSERYDNSLHFSPLFQEYAHSLAENLIEKHGIRNKNVIEIGCGKGDFLVLLCELGNNRCVGFDPSYEEQPSHRRLANQLTFVNDFYSERYARYEADLICCRYVFEHIPQPAEFLSMVRRTIGNRVNTVVYFEVPNVSLILRELSVWDIIYEHCSYFCSSALARVFRSCGFSVQSVIGAFGDQFLGIEASPSNRMSSTKASAWEDVTWVADAVAAFAENYRKRIATWEESLKQIERANQRAVVWGSGAKGVSFLNMLKVDTQVGYVVDINPHKQGMRVAGTGHRIVPPEFLQEYRPDIVIIMNPIYEEEIGKTMAGLGLSTKFMYA
jgi:ubiquinone/menaquinone biosynthesis C-methylase UbiE